MTELPKTGSGKLLRRILRAREPGLPGGNALKMKDGLIFGQRKYSVIRAVTNVRIRGR